MLDCWVSKSSQMVGSCWFSLENVDVYHMDVGKVATIIEESACRGIMVLGGFNADATVGSS